MSESTNNLEAPSVNNQNFVEFKTGKYEDYHTLDKHDDNTIYFCEDSGDIYKGDTLYLSSDIRTYKTYDEMINDSFINYGEYSQAYRHICYVIDDRAFYMKDDTQAIIPVVRVVEVDNWDNIDDVTALEDAYRKGCTVSIDSIIRLKNTIIDELVSRINILTIMVNSMPTPMQSDLNITFDTGKSDYVKNVPWRSDYTLNNTPLGVSQSIVYGDLTNNLHAYYNQQLGAEYEIKVPDTTKFLCGTPVYVGDLYEITLNNVQVKCRLILTNNQLYLAECDDSDLPLVWKTLESMPTTMPGFNAAAMLPLYVQNHFCAVFEPHRIDKMLTPGEKVKGHFEIQRLGSDLSKFNLSAPEPKTFTFTPIWEKAPELNTDKTYKVTFDAGEGNIIAGYNTSKITFTMNNGDKYKDVLKRLPTAYHPASANDTDVTIYSFGHWYCDKYGFTLTEGDIENDGYFAAYEDVTFNAQWNTPYHYESNESESYTYKRSINTSGSNILRFECNGTYTSEDGESVNISGEFFEEKSVDEPIDIPCDCGTTYSSVIRKCIMRYHALMNLNSVWQSWEEPPIVLADGYIHTGWYCEEFNYTLSLADYLAYGNTAYWNIKRYTETKHTMPPETLPAIDWNASEEGGDEYYIHNRPFGTNYTRESNITAFPGLSWSNYNIVYHCSDRMISGESNYIGAYWSGDITSFCEENSFFDSVQFTVQGRSWMDSSGGWRMYSPKPMNLGRVYCSIIDGSLYMCDKEIIDGVIPEGYRLLFKITENEDQPNYWIFNLEYLDYEFLEDYFDENPDMPEDFPQLHMDLIRKYLTVTNLQGYKVRTSIDKIDSKYLPDIPHPESDWNAYEGDVGFIKNKPFYKDKDTYANTFSGFSINYAGLDYDPTALECINNETWTAVDENKEYDVVINGVAVRCHFIPRDTAFPHQYYYFGSGTGSFSEPYVTGEVLGGGYSKSNNSVSIYGLDSSYFNLPDEELNLSYDCCGWESPVMSDEEAAKTWTVTFDPGENAVMYGRRVYKINSGETYRSLFENTSLKIPFAIKDGYILKGWSCEKYGYELSLDDVYTVAEDVTFTAIWEEGTYTVSQYKESGKCKITCARYASGGSKLLIIPSHSWYMNYGDSFADTMGVITPSILFDERESTPLSEVLYIKEGATNVDCGILTDNGYDINSTLRIGHTTSIEISEIVPGEIHKLSGEYVDFSEIYSSIQNLGTVFSYRGSITSEIFSSGNSILIQNVCKPGYVFNVTEEFTANDLFVEDAVGKTYPAGTNIVVVKTDDGTNKLDVLSGAIDLSNYYDKTETEAIIAEQIANIPNPNWDAQEGEDGYIENRPFGEKVDIECEFLINSTTVGRTYTPMTSLDHSGYDWSFINPETGEELTNWTYLSGDLVHTTDEGITDFEANIYGLPPTQWELFTSINNLPEDYSARIILVKTTLKKIDSKFYDVHWNDVIDRPPCGKRIEQGFYLSLSSPTEDGYPWFDPIINSDNTANSSYKAYSDIDATLNTDDKWVIKLGSTDVTDSYNISYNEDVILFEWDNVLTFEITEKEFKPISGSRNSLLGYSSLEIYQLCHKIDKLPAEWVDLPEFTEDEIITLVDELLTDE